jgi:acid stress chaperone HdeB
MTRIICFASAILIGAAAMPVSAQINLDMNKITCGDWLGYDPTSKEFVRFWLSGYYNAAQNSNVLDMNRLQRNSAKVADYCKKHKSQSLPTAIKNAAS